MALRKIQKFTSSVISALKNLSKSQQGALDRTGTITRAVTPEEIQRIFLQASSPGELGDLIQLYKKIEKYDGKLSGLIERRRKAPTKYESSIKIHDESIARTEEVKEFLEKAMRFIDEKQLKRDCMNGILWGVNIGVQNWKRIQDDDGKFWLILKNPYKISAGRYGQSNDSFLTDTSEWGKLYIRKNHVGSDRLYIDDYGDDVFFKAVYSDEPGFHDMSGILRPVPKQYMFKDSSYKYWVEYSETFGFPTSVVKVDKSDYQTYKKELEEFMSSVGRGKFGILFNGMEYEIHANQYNGQIDVFRELVKYINDEMSFTIVGQNMTENKSGKGSYASSVIGHDIEIDILLDDAEFVDRIITNHIVKQLVIKNFKNYPAENFYYYTNTPERKDYERLLEKWKLAGQLKLKGVSKKQIEDELEVEFAENEEDSIDLNLQKVQDKKADAERKKEEREEGDQSVVNE